MKHLRTCLAASLAAMLCFSTSAISRSRIAVCGNSMLFYGGFVRQGQQCCPDDGMLQMLCDLRGFDAEVIDCTYGGHHLMDFSSQGCKWEERHGPQGGPQKASGGCSGLHNDLLKGVNLQDVDYLIFSEAGNDFDHFYSDAKTLAERFRSANPKVRMFYVNHIYSVFKEHHNVLDNLAKLHDSLGVTIINCGQMACDIYSGRLKVPAGELSYCDKYTFVNRCKGDSHHPNPLMGYIMTLMTYCALSGELPGKMPVKQLVEKSRYASGNVTYGEYYSRYYTTEADLPYFRVLESASEMSGIQELIPSYIDRY